MTLTTVLPLSIVASAFVPAVLIFFTEERALWLRRGLNFTGTLSCLALIGLLLNGVAKGESYESRLPLLPEIDLVLHADALSLLFVSLSGLLWLITTIYAIGYLEGTKNRSRFFGFFSLCVAATLGIALAGNLITFLIFYELLTLATYPLVVHKGNPASLRAGKVYLGYTLVGGAFLLAGVVWLKALAGPLDFTATGILSTLPELNTEHLKIIFVLLLVGLGVKAALFPLHGWLPIAMAAPAPVSALLHAVAVVKAGSFGIIRVVYDVYGIEFARELGLTAGLAAVAAFTIVYGSVVAVRQNDLKRRLAYSTVSQVSYIALGTAIAGPIATIGGMIHLVHQGVMKITLFFCAGNLAETLGIHKVSELDGVARRMPITMTAFTMAALGMIGVPPIAGFVSKWYLGTGALEVDAYWVLGILATSSLLNAIYFLPLLHAAWFKPPIQDWATKRTKLEAPLMLLLPPAITALLALAIGLFTSLAFSPLSWAALIAAREYGGQKVHEIFAPVFQFPSLIWAIVTPLLFALGLLSQTARRYIILMVPLAALPALLMVATLPDTSQSLTWLFFGSVLELNESSRMMLLLAAILWIIASAYGNGYFSNSDNRARYTAFFLVCMASSFGITLSQDLFGFIAFFATMSFASYGLIIHSGSEYAAQAASTYIKWVVVGELCLFAAFTGLAIAGGGTELNSIDLALQPIWVSWLLLFGFGIKAGMLTAHFWLPLAHPVAPVPASALLSGLMVKAGLIGWWRFLPMGESPLPELGITLVILGLSGAFFGVIYGLVQRNAKSLLAYSTISQMGIVAAGLGAGLLAPHLWPTLSAALVIYALHHGLAKAALFLSVGLSFRSDSRLLRHLVWVATCLPALALIGTPYTSGALAKTALKSSLSDISWITQLLPVTAVGTTLLMVKFMLLLKTQYSENAINQPSKKIQIISFAVLILLVAITVYLVPQASYYTHYAFSFKSQWPALWPALTGLLLYFVALPLINRLAQTPITSILRNIKDKTQISMPDSFRSRRNYSQVLSPFKITAAFKNSWPCLLLYRAPVLHPSLVFIGVLVAVGLAFSVNLIT